MTDVGSPAPGHPDQHDLDLLDGALYAGDPEPTYAWPGERPLYWDATNRLWGVRATPTSSPSRRTRPPSRAIWGFRPNTGPDTSMISLDDPPHLPPSPRVAPLHPRAAGATRSDVRRVVTSLIDAVAARGECEVVHDLAAPCRR